ncbi:MAG: transposase [Verrucomicrobia bacterium]|nr:transposase [Verrucomicrobiota bacterium]
MLGEILQITSWSRSCAVSGAQDPAHSRRKFYEMRTSDVPGATTAPAYIGLLYKNERRARDLGSADRFALRQRCALPVLIHFREFLERERARVLPKSPFGAAVGYTLWSWAALCRYSDDGDLVIDNNVRNAASGIIISVPGVGAQPSAARDHRPGEELSGTARDGRNAGPFTLASPA